ncbi:MAG TPA: VCBS repeat-containing protein [Solirubrobacteraceae bacterium]|nr:VCBS repeat-containing protein [Solirubrobacteraceae bacterium]
MGQPISLPEIGPVYAGDFTGAGGTEDVVVAPDGCWGGSDSNKYYMLLGDDHGNLTPGPVYTSPRIGGCGSFVGDFTGDGRDDVLTQPMSPGEEEAIVVLPGESNGSFGPPIVTPTPQLASYSAFVGRVGETMARGQTTREDQSARKHSDRDDVLLLVE